MKIFVELARFFYGINVPKMKVKKFISLVLDYLEKRYSIETAIGKALSRMGLA